MNHYYKKTFVEKTKKLLKLWPIFILYFILYISGIGCPIKFITGLSCPGCGFTRAFISLITFNLKDVFYYHPAFLLFPVAFVMLYYFDNKICRFIGWLSVLIIIIVYFIRLFNPDDMVVYFNYKESAIFNLFNIML